MVAVQAALIADLRATNAALRGRLGDLEAANARLAEANAALATRVAELERRLRQDSSNSSNPSQDGLGNATRPARRADGGRRPGKQPGPRARTWRRLPAPTRSLSTFLTGAVAAAVSSRARRSPGPRSVRCSTCPSCAWPSPSIGSNMASLLVRFSLDAPLASAAVLKPGYGGSSRCGLFVPSYSLAKITQHALSGRRSPGRLSPANR
jgi:hypothetical protein